MKRRATDELTPENWSSAADNEAPDGGFEKASEEELAKRSFKKAKRRLGEGTSSTGSDSDASLGTSGLFAGFKGFSSSSSSMAMSPGESKTFRASSSGSVSSLATTSLGLSALGSTKSPLSSTSKSPLSYALSSNVAPVSSLSGSLATENSLTQEEYEARLSALNTSFVNWIRKHHEKDPLADFTPTFDDYKKHLSKLDTQLQGASSSSSSPSSSKSVFATPPSTAAPALTLGHSSVPLNGGSSFGGSLSASPASDSSKTVKFAPISTGASSSTTSSSSGTGTGATSSGGTAAGLFSFSSGTATSAPAAAASSSSGEIGSSFKVGSSGLTFPASILKSSPSSTSASGVLGLAPATNVSSGFFSGLVSSSTGGSSGGVPSFLLGKKDEQASGSGGGDDDDDADEEKDDMKPQEFDQDADILHKVRAKLFYKKGDGWSELGVGDFKVINMDGKSQLLMRNDTRLGTILLNVMLSKSTPCSRSGKNNVMLVSLPNPPLQRGNRDDDSDKATPVQYLIRVKSGDAADELHKKISERKE